MIEKLKDSTFVVFDCETTGLDWSAGHQIIELAAQKVKDSEVIDEFYALINPSIAVEDGAYATHGLSNLYLAEHGGNAAEHFPKFKEFIEGTILVGHNILTFDLPYVNIEFKRHSLPAINNSAIDTLVMSRKVLTTLPNHKLTTIATHFKIDPSGAHRAMVDVEMNRKVFYKMLDQYLKKLSEEEHLKKAHNAGKLF